MNTTAARQLTPSLPVRSILSAGLAVALLDYAYVWILWVVALGRTTPVRLLQSIASGLLGREAYVHGAASAVLGAGLHLCIATGWAGAYGIALRVRGGLRRTTATPAGAYRTGMAVGAAIWLVMDFVVLPLSRARFVPPSTWPFWGSLAHHVLVLGPAIALIVRPGKR